VHPDLQAANLHPGFKKHAHLSTSIYTSADKMQVLSGVQTFTSMIDLVIAGAQNLIASAVWGVIKTAFQVRVFHLCQSKAISRMSPSVP